MQEIKFNVLDNEELSTKTIGYIDMLNVSDSICFKICVGIFDIINENPILKKLKINTSIQYAEIKEMKKTKWFILFENINYENQEKLIIELEKIKYLNQIKLDIYSDKYTLKADLL
jgi:hypothetical protein